MLEATAARRDRRGGRGARGSRVAVLWALVGSLLAGCVTVVTTGEPAGDSVPAAAVPVTVPLGGPGWGDGDPNAAALDAYYGSVVVQLQDAVLERNPEQLAGLLAMHDRPVAPDWAQARMAQFRQLVRVIEFERHAERNVRLSIEGDSPTIGELVPLGVRVVGRPVRGLVLPGEDLADAPLRILVEAVVVDYDCYGDHTRREFGQILPLERSVDVESGEPFEMFFAVPELAPDGCRRVLEVSCNLLPGSVLLDGDPVPNQSVPLGAQRFELFPRGIAGLRQNPYAHLRGGLERGDPAHFDNVFLAAREMSEEFREDAIRKLVEHLRVGRPDVARVCMASLRELTGLDLSIDDRDAWLEWWQQRNS